MKQISVRTTLTALLVGLAVAASLTIARPKARLLDATGMMPEVVVRAACPRLVMDEVVVRADRYAVVTVPAMAGASLN
jgi:hypothetical protein